MKNIVSKTSLSIIALTFGLSSTTALADMDERFEGIDKIEITISSGDLVIIKSSDSDVHVSLEENLGDSRVDREIDVLWNVAIDRGDHKSVKLRNHNAD